MTAAINADRLRSAIAIRGVTQAQFASAAGLDADTVSRAVRGRSVTSGTLRKMVRALVALPAMAGAEELIDVG